MIPDRQLSAHYRLHEFLDSTIASRHGVDNGNPPAEVVVALEALCANLLEPIRVAVGGPVVVDSGWRCDPLNVLVRGARDSQHRLGEASDLKTPTMDHLHLAHVIAELADRGVLVFDQLILEHYVVGSPKSGWCHVSYRSGRNRGMVLHTIPQGGDVVAYVNGLPGE